MDDTADLASQEDVMKAARAIANELACSPICGSPSLAFPVIARALLAGRLAERERCARVAENSHERWRMPRPDDAEPGEVCDDISACADIAAAIRRGDAP